MPPLRPSRFSLITPHWLKVFGSWLVQEEFWKTVVSQAFAGLIVVALGYIYALGAGTVPKPTNENIVIDVLIVLVATSISVVFAVVFAAIGDVVIRGPATPLFIAAGGWFWGSAWWRRLVQYAYRLVVIAVAVAGAIGLSAILMSVLEP